MPKREIDTRDAEQMARAMADFANRMGRGEHIEEFVAEMGNEHRTLQQMFTKLCLRWIEHVGHEEYRSDLRNIDSHIACAEMVRCYTAEHGGTLPSHTLRFI